jgi:serine protease Do
MLVLPAAHALSPEELFTRVSPSVYFVYGADSNERRLTQGSGVVIAPQRVITNCHVVRDASFVFVRKENVIYLSKVEHRDPKRDLCQLQVPNLAAPAVTLGNSRDLKVGQKVYALGNPKGLEVTLSDGLVSALRGPDGVDPIIQTTAPISPGSSGGGLFDGEGRLVGITTLQRPDGQNLNFALPAEWVAELPERMRLVAEEAAQAKKKKEEQIASLRASGISFNPASPELPVVGTEWKYRYVDHKYSNSQTYALKVTAVDGWNVTETFQLEGGSGSGRQQAVVGADELNFVLRKLGVERTAIEFSPYLLARGDVAAQAHWSSRNTSYPGNQQSPWMVTSRVFGEDSIGVPAGSFKVTRIDVSGRREQGGNVGAGMNAGFSLAGRFLYQIWYSPEARRYVKVRHQLWNIGGALIGDETLELVSYKAE